MAYKAPVKEIFTSIQGEGALIGAKQLFIRLTGCNLHCDYCDTPSSKTLGSIMTTDDLVTKIYNCDTDRIHSIALTGGEPLLHYKFIKELLSKLEHRIYLETNGTLADELAYIGNHIDFIAMDIKLNSACKQGDLFEQHRSFLKCAKRLDAATFVKIVFDENITDDEIAKSSQITEEFNLPLILQPKQLGTGITQSKEQLLATFNKFIKLHHNTRLISQMHKTLGID